MTLSIEISNEAPDHWNDFLLETETGTIYNSKEYAVYSPNENEHPKFLRIIDSTGNIRLQTLLLEKSNKQEKFKVLSRFSKKFSDIIKWNYGPVTTSENATELFFKYLKNSKKRVYGNTHPLSSIKQEEFNSKEWGTFLINLSDEKEKVFGKIDKKSGRKNIERSIERGVEIEEIDDKSLLEYLELYNLTKIKEGGIETDVETMKNFWKILKPAGFSGFIARKNETCVGGMLFSFFNGYINEWGVARSPEDYSKKLYSQDLIKWKIIEWGVERNMKYYDFTGFNPNPKTTKEKGILRYKKKWGGQKYSQLIIKN